MSELFLTAVRNPGQGLQQWIWFWPGIVLDVVGEEISYIGHPNVIRRGDEPITTFCAAP
jgi:hypothetical protein